MNYSFSFARRTAPTQPLHRRVAASIVARLRRSARPREHFLASACSHADLEQRMRHWDSQQQRAAGLCVGH